jgi:maltose 6'-phosphate phosphatase
MKAIQLLYAANTISRKKRIARQTLSFFMVAENVGHDKQVDVLWAGEDGIWRTLQAKFHSSTAQDKEFWYAEAKFQLSSKVSLPGNIQFALRYRVSGKEYWDNNDDQNYSIAADSGVRLREDIPILNIGLNRRLKQGQKSYRVTLAVRSSLRPSQINIYWTTNHWKNFYKTPCFFHRTYWNHTLHSNAGNPNKYGYEIWVGRIKIGEAYRVEYAIACDTEKEEIWDNNFGNNYIARREDLKILTLNLHCYQEANQNHKFSKIARAINELNVDIICLQEVCENWNNGQGDWNTNAAKIIRDHLAKPYHLYTDWSHIGFDRYREGIAILSRYEFLMKESGYVSQCDDMYNIHCRRVVMGQVYVPYMGRINVFSAHLSWWSDGFKEQFERLREWANRGHSKDVVATFLGGDFNIQAGSQGYVSVVNTKEYEDQFLKATSRNIFDGVFRKSSSNWPQTLANDYRIDYIFMKKGSDLKVTSARILFSEHDYGRVSDHEGYLMTFEPE